MCHGNSALEWNVAKDFPVEELLEQDKIPSVHIKFNLPVSCPEIPWSDLEDVLDRRTKKPKILGSGSFGIVKLMKHQSSGKLCAVKINKDDIEEPTVIENLQLEVGVLTRLKHLDCVPELFGVTIPGNNSQVPVMVQEFIGDPKTFRSTMLAIAIEAKVLPPLKAKRVALRICEALRDIHSAKLLHCDLKNDNIMLEPGFVRKDNPKVKIIDFGKAVKMDDKPRYQYNARDQMSWIMKCCSHLAPEVVRGEKPYNVSSEVYGLGVVLKDLSKHFRGFLWQLGEECTDADYRKRPSVEDVIHKIKSHLTSIQGAASQLAAP
ncbi:Serine/threonine-protein kinase D3 [Holothuria leucospilota]|uniref:Serine/threonine-protein kinase D3 n=1 Tax=Holothuria leucospilota TaxID=206669 RepID=A0A9Q1CF58_HOLLE|nr:Serine/threonine-protein kinase D3 [Holothuria leucospilota]